MNLIPPTITALASSTKAVNFWVLLGLFFLRGEIGLTIEWFQWMVIAFVGWVVAQGLADFGKGKSQIETKAQTTAARTAAKVIAESQAPK